MYRTIAILLVAVAAVTATPVSNCPNKPAPLSVNIIGCNSQPCNVVQGSDVQMQLHFVAKNGASDITTQVVAYIAGIPIPFYPPEAVKNVCTNLMDGASCPLDAGEDVTYLFRLPIGKYPKITLKVQISVVDSKKNVFACFQTQVKVVGA